MVLSRLFEHDWKSVDINPPKGVGAALRGPLAEVTGLASRNCNVARHCSVWTRCPSNSKQLVRNQQWHSKAQADRLGFWVASPVGSAFRAVSIHRPWSDNSDINFIRLVKLCLLLKAPQCPGTECPPEQSPMTSPGQISKNSATV